MTIRVVIADDHRVVREGLCYLLGQEPDVEVAGEAGDGRQTINVVAATRPDVLLLDLYMPGLDGHAVIDALRDAPHRPAVVVLTSATDDEHLVRAVHAGAISYLLKTAPAEDVVAAVRDAAVGTASLSPELLTRLTQALRRPAPPDPLQPLSPRERDVLRLIARGHSNRQIARDLAIGEQTVKTHVRSILPSAGSSARLADGGAEQAPDAIGERQAERSADDDAQDGAADVAAAQVRAEGAGRARATRTAAKVTGTRRPAGGSRIESIGSSAPETKDSAEAPAAWIGLARSDGSICSSASRWASGRHARSARWRRCGRSRGRGPWLRIEPSAR